MLSYLLVQHSRVENTSFLEFIVPGWIWYPENRRFDCNGAGWTSLMVTITFPDPETEHRALAILQGKFAGLVFHVVPDQALEALANNNISFSIRDWPQESNLECQKAIGVMLDDLGRLGPNWDGYGAPVIDPAIIGSARQWSRAMHFNICPRVVPMAGGNLQLEWHSGPKILEIEFESPETIHYLKWLPEKIEEEATFPVSDIEKAAQLLAWFAGEN
jgi:hypothetical protein